MKNTVHIKANKEMQQFASLIQFLTILFVVYMFSQIVKRVSNVILPHTHV